MTTITSLRQARTSDLRTALVLFALAVLGGWLFLESIPEALETMKEIKKAIYQLLLEISTPKNYL